MDTHAPSMEGVLPLPSSSAPIGAASPELTGDTESPPPGPASPNAVAPSFTAALLAQEGAFAPRREAARFGIGLGLAALYGVALGMRQGGRSLLVHAVSVPAALLGTVALGVPALYIALALFDAPIDPPRAIAAAARAAARTGLVLAGLAPAAALFVVSSEEPRAAAGAAMVGLATAGAIGLLRMVDELHGALAQAPASMRAKADVTFFGFAVFAVALSARIWWATLPLLRGGR